MKASPRTSVVLVSTLIAGGLVAGSVSQTVLTPKSTGFLGTAGTFFPALIQTVEAPQNSGAKSSSSTAVVASTTNPAEGNVTPSVTGVRTLVEPIPTTSLTPDPTLSLEPTVAPEPTSTPATEVAPEPSFSPSSMPVPEESPLP